MPNDIMISDGKVYSAYLGGKAWQDQKHQRMMYAIARAGKLGFEVKLTMMGVAGNNIGIDIIDHDCQLCCDTKYTMFALTESKIELLERDLKRLEQQREAATQRARLREQLLERLTPEERDLLGV